MNKIIYLFSKSEKKKNPVHVQIFKKTHRLERAQYMRCGSLKSTYAMQYWGITLIQVRL